MQALLTGQGATFNSSIHGERSALLFFKNKLYVNYGGHFGDCGNYHGTVAQIDPETATLDANWQTRAGGGGIWAQGGIAGDGTNLFVTTGNTFGASTLGGWRGDHSPASGPRAFQRHARLLRAVELEEPRQFRRGSGRHRGAADRHQDGRQSPGA